MFPSLHPWGGRQGWLQNWLYMGRDHIQLTVGTLYHHWVGYWGADSSVFQTRIWTAEVQVSSAGGGRVLGVLVQRTQSPQTCPDGVIA